MIKFREKQNFTIVPITKDLIEKYKNSNNLLRHLDSKDTGYMLLDNRNNLIGYISWDKNIITALEVLKDFQGKGYSKVLLGIALDNGCDELTVNESNKNARGVYEHLGWKLSGKLGSKMLIYRK